MENKKGKLNVLTKIEQSLKLQLITCFTLSFIVIIGILVINNILEGIKYYEYKLVDDISLVNAIESITRDDDKLILKGYAFLLDKNSKDNSISIFLRNEDKSEEIWLDTDQLTRSDVDVFFDSEYDYANSGFIASISGEELDMDAVYEIIVNIDYKETFYKVLNRKVRKTVSTERYIYKDKIYAYNPIEFDMPDKNIGSELLFEVVNNGQLCFYLKEAGIYVYQFEGKLFWIATKEFKFDEEGITYIPYYVYTTQVNRLPEHRRQAKYENLDFIFEDYEYKDEPTSPYRVAIRDIPKDYVISYIHTGLYNSKNQNWLWDKSFHLNNIIN